MEKITFITRFRKNRKWNSDDIMTIINRNNLNFVSMNETPYGNTTMKIECSEEQYYNVFVKSVEKMYPGLCDFDI